MKKHLGTILRIGITVLGLALAFSAIDFSQLVDKFAHARWEWLLLAFLLINLSLVLRAYRWLLLLQGLGVKNVKFSRLVELYFAGNFFNSFLPSGFGGDVVRVVEVAQEVPTDVATGTVFLDRFTGLLILFVMGLLALPFRPENFPDVWAAAIALVCVAGLVGGFVLLDGRLIRKLGGWLPGPLNPNGDTPIAKFLQAVQGCGWQAIGGALAVSTVFAFMLVGWWTATTHAMNAPVPFAYNLLVVPIFAVALLVPTFGGIGVREALAGPLYAAAGLDPATAVAVALAVTLLLRLAGLLGAPIYVWTTIRKKRATSQQTA
ncbi:MAG: flippase-like domain-containing protein [Anaerolineales bacterium]|nr:flippase-like domain-containing protein [Anaerolineales bacterium]